MLLLSLNAIMTVLFCNIPSGFDANVLLFASLVNAAPEVSLAGLGATLIIMSVLIELNSAKIWSERLKSVKKLKKMSALQRPKKIYYNINVYILWPFIIFMAGCRCGRPTI